MGTKTTEQLTAAEQLRKRLSDLEWSQSDLAERLDVSTAVVSRWLSGERTPSLEMAFRIQHSEIGLLAEIWLEAAEAKPSKPAA